MIEFFKRLPRALPGLILIVATLYAIRTWVEPWMANAVILGQKGWLIKVLHLNYILLGIIAGMLYRNLIFPLLFKAEMPEVFADGFKLSRLMIKTGIILLGSLYTVQAIVTLGATAIFLIGGFVVAHHRHGPVARQAVRAGPLHDGGHGQRLVHLRGQRRSGHLAGGGGQG